MGRLTSLWTGGAVGVAARTCAAVSALVLLAGGAASADSLDIARGDGSWHAFEAPSTSGTAYWNNWSIDNNHECNIGYWLNGTGGCTANGGTFMANSPVVTPNYLGDGGTGFGLTRAAGTESVTITSHLEVSSYRTTNEFGWFDRSAPGVLNFLFRGTVPAGTTATFVPSGTYGFYLTSLEGTYLSTGTGDARTHFAVFQLSGSDHYMVGAEDMWTASDWDYNDAAFEIQVNAVPEPATMVSLALGLFGLAVARRRSHR